jgi:hypothetical protein
MSEMSQDLASKHCEQERFAQTGVMFTYFASLRTATLDGSSAAQALPQASPRLPSRTKAWMKSHRGERQELPMR